MTQTLSKNVIADFSTQLAVKMAVGATTGTLASATDSDGVALPTGTYFLTLDKNNSKKEYIKCTLTGTALTSIQSISRQGALTSGTAREHRVGANVIISDFASLSKMNDLLSGATDFDSGTPLKYDGTATINNDAQFATKKYVDDSTVGISGDETVAGVKTFSSSPIVPTPTTDMQVATKKYADDLAIAGSPDASTTVKGIVEEATNAEIVAGTGTGTTGARLFINPTQVATSGANKVLLTKTDGTLDSSVVPQPTVIDTASLGNNLKSLYSDTANTRISTQSGTVSLEQSDYPLQSRLLSSDWASISDISGFVRLGAYFYALIYDASNNYRLYRYDRTNLSAGGTLMTIATQAFSTTGGASVKMTSDGIFFYFSFKGGNSANDYVISKYTVSGTTLTYDSDITCGSTSGDVADFVVDTSSNIYGIKNSDKTFRKYNSSGTLQYTTSPFQLATSLLSNISGTFYAQMNSPQRLVKIILT